MTSGRDLALDQVQRIAAERAGAVDVTGTVEVRKYLRITLSIDCRGFPHEPGGVRLRERERFHIWVDDSFPLKPPSTIQVAHKRWENVEHVQWRDQLCIYQAPDTEWDPADGMFGLLDRLLTWLAAASVGELDAAGGPIHPPAVYVSRNCPMIIPRADTPRTDDGSWWGFARVADYGEHRRDIIGWCEISKANEAVDAGDAVSPALLLSDPLPWEYPTTFLSLLLALVERGVSIRLLFRLLHVGHILHNGDFVYIVVGSPMRGTVGGDTRQHLAVWRIKASDVAAFYETIPQDNDSPEQDAEREAAWHRLIDWAAENTIKVDWCPVREARPEVTRPRDEGSPMELWAGKRVSIWGCGALGGAVAEYLVRAGVRDLVLRDNADVAPGLLVRQNFENLDLGAPKAAALKARLERIEPTAKIATFMDNLTADREAEWSDGADLVLDLTASTAVAQRLELSRTQHPSPALVVGMMISHDASSGLVVASRGYATGGPVDVRRKAKLHVARSEKLQSLADAFWPLDPVRTSGFVPEPGCSSPTFVGSGAEVAALASTMLVTVTNMAHEPQPMAAALVWLPKPDLAGGTYLASFPNDTVTTDAIGGREVRTSPEALAEMRAWARRSARLAPGYETGGHLYGQRDDALGVVWITDIGGPPPDSKADPMFFECGTEGVVDASLAIEARSRDASRPVGVWHTHPDSLPLPSDKDIDGMEQIVNDPDTATPVHVLAILGGDPEEALLGTYVYERRKPNEVTIPVELAAVPPETVREHRIGLALSGGGFRAVAFHLGVMRALNDRGILDRIDVISSVSGGSVITALWAYGPETFEEFDARITALLESGLNWRIAAQAFSPRHAPKQLASFVSSGIASIFRAGWSGARRAAGKPTSRTAPRLRRSQTLTLAVQRVIESELTGARLNAPVKDVEVVINACDLRTGTAFRFGSRETGSWRYGTVPGNDLPVALAVATSAAYPVFLPAVDIELTFERNGDRKDSRVLLSDGGVYDNLGTTCLEPGRSGGHSTNVHPVDYVISADAGRGALNANARPVFWMGRMKRSFESVYRKVQDAEKKKLHLYLDSGKLQGAVMPYLGQADARLPICPPDLVRRNEVIDYPTNFSRVKPDDLARLTARGEQLTRLMIEQHCPEIA